MNTSHPLAMIAATGVASLALVVPGSMPRPALAPTPFPSVATSDQSAYASALTGTVPDARSRGVVLIDATTQTGEAAGTGMVLTASGQVLTNYHVVEGSTALEATIADTGQTFTATVVGHDAARDVALLQLRDASGLATITPDDDAVAVGDALTAVGNASGGGSLVAATGRITAVNQEVTVSNEGVPSTLTGVIATDAGAVPGDSGGPMFDHEAEVSAMTTAGGQYVTAGRRGARGGTVTSVSYAVPITTALAVVDQIRTGRDAGTTQVGPRGYLGVSVGASTSLVISSVLPDGPAAASGLEPGALITSIDGTAVTTHDELADVLTRLDPGQRVTVTWLDAAGASRSSTVVLGASPVN